MMNKTVAFCAYLILIPTSRSRALFKIIPEVPCSVASNPLTCCWLIPNPSGLKVIKSTLDFPMIPLTLSLSPVNIEGVKINKKLICERKIPN